MRAVRIERFGTPAVLAVKTIPDLVARPDEVVVAVHAAAVNPVDVANVAGRAELTRLPRTPGLDFAGIVVKGPERLRGVEVWGTGGNLGITQDGTHAEYVVIPGRAVRPKPSRLYMEQAAAVATQRGWPIPSYRCVYGVIKQIAPGLLTLAHRGTETYREQFDLLYRREASTPNNVRQVDHSLLDIWLLDQRPNRKTGMAPQAQWDAGGFLPRLPDSLEQLDLLLLTVAKARPVGWDSLSGLLHCGEEFPGDGLRCYEGTSSHIGRTTPLNPAIHTLTPPAQPAPPEGARDL